MLTLTFASDAPGPDDRIAREVHVWRDDRGDAIARAFVGSHLRWLDWPPFGRFAFTRDGHVTVWPSGDADPSAITAHFERVLQPLVLQATGCQSLHASAVRHDTAALAFCGERGAGKSTVAYAMRHSGWTQIADDAVVLQAKGERTVVRPLPFTPRFWDASFEYFAAGADTLPFRTSHFDLRDVPLAAVFLLRRDDSIVDPHIERVTLMDAFSHLLGHALSFDPNDVSEARRLVEDYLSVARQVPVFALAYPSDFSRLSGVIDAVARAASELGASAPAALHA